MKIERLTVLKLLTFCFILLANETLIFSEQSNNKSDFTKLKGKYLGQKPPTNTPALFAPGIVSTKHFEHSSPTFSPDGNEMYWSVHYPRELKSNRPIMYMKRINDLWTKPEEPLFSSNYYNGNPFFSPDGKKLYFGSNRPLKKNGKLKQSRIWFVEKSGTDWSKPLSLNSVINSTGQEAQPAISKNGTLFFLSHYKDASPPYGIYYSKSVNGKYLKKQILKKSFNTKHPDWTPYIAPDESYFIFCSFRPGGFGSGDLYISFKQKDGSWGQIKNMGNKINTGRNERFPIITPDKKYLFFNSTKRIPQANEDSPGNGKGDIYWVSSSIINHLKTEDLNIVGILADTVKQNGVDSISEKFEVLKIRHKEYFNFNEKTLFLTAMKFIRSKKPLLALDILKKNCTLFPEKQFAPQQLLISILKNDSTSLQELNPELINQKKTRSKILNDELNNLGYQLYEMEEFKKAVRVFGFIVKLFPESLSAYKNYAEILTVNGDIKAAIINYKKVLSINPKNKNANTMIKKLEKDLDKFSDLKGQYLGQKPPGLKPEIFAPGIISTIHQEHSSLAFSPDGNEIYWSIWPKSESGKRIPQQIMYTEIVKGFWIKPEIAPFSGQFMDGGPCFSDDGQKLYFYSRRPHKKGGKPNKYLDIWMVKKIKSGWSEPLLMPSPINSVLNDASPFIGSDKTFYLSRKTEDLPFNNIFQFKYKNGRYLKGENISPNVNKKDARESSFTISKDNSFIIFASDNRKFEKGKRTSGERNLMVSFKNNDGKWGKAINTGKVFNDKQARFPSLSNDGKYLFFTRYDKKGNEDFYWVSTKIINDLRPEDSVKKKEYKND